MAATLKQIAARTGLSTQTISQCLRPDGPKAHLYRPDTRETVLRAARELGYRPNAAARAMAHRRFDVATLVMSIDPVRSSLFGGVLCGLHDSLAENGMRMSIARLPDEALTDERHMPVFLKDRCSDGLLINYTDSIPRRMIQIIHEHQLPAVWINSCHRGDCVHPDDERAGYDATRHLITLGHHSIAFLDLSHGVAYAGPHYSVTARLDGYRRALAQEGLAPRILRSEQGERIERPDRVAFVRGVLERADRPTAIVTYSQTDVMVVLTAALSLGINVPGGLSLVSFGSRPFDYLEAAVTTWVLPELEMGQAAVELLIQKIDHPGDMLPPRVLPLRLLDGATCAPPRR